MERNIKYFERLVTFLILFIVLSLIVSVLAYRSVFDGSLSELSGDWGALGSFFGGVFSPIIAFATLIAIIITIHLQKQLLNTQSKEFTKLYDLQTQTLATQKSELDLAKIQALEQADNEHKKLYLGLIEQQIDIRRTNMIRAAEGAAFMLEKHDKGYPIDSSAIESNIQQKELLEKQVQVLTFVSIGFAIKKFKSIENMDESITRLFQMIDNPDVLESLYASQGQNFDYGSK